MLIKWAPGVPTSMDRLKKTNTLETHFCKLHQYQSFNCNYFSIGSFLYIKVLIAINYVFDIAEFFLMFFYIENLTW